MSSHHTRIIPSFFQYHNPSLFGFPTSKVKVNYFNWRRTLCFRFFGNHFSAMLQCSTEQFCGAQTQAPFSKQTGLPADIIECNRLRYFVHRLCLRGTWNVADRPKHWTHLDSRGVCPISCLKPAFTLSRFHNFRSFSSQTRGFT